MDDQMNEFNFDSLLARRRRLDEMGIQDDDQDEAPSSITSAAPAARTQRAAPTTGSSIARAALFTTMLFSVMAPTTQTSIPVGITSTMEQDLRRQQHHYAFPSNQTSGFTNFHLVRGRPVHGVLIDSGAAKALMGTETLRQYVGEVLKPNSRSISTRPSDSSFTGCLLYTSDAADD